MKGCYETPGGYLDGGDVKRMRISQNMGLRPGKQVNNSIIITLGRAIIAGKPLCATANELGISRKTAYRWAKRLKLGRYTK